jgi:hypothetical protein
MESKEGSETSAISTRTPGKHPKRNILHIKHGKSLKSRILHIYREDTTRHIRLFEKLCIKETKFLTSLNFLLRCRDHNTIPWFLQLHHNIPSRPPTEFINAPALPCYRKGYTKRDENWTSHPDSCWIHTYELPIDFLNWTGFCLTISWWQKPSHASEGVQQGQTTQEVCTTPH